MPQLCVPSLIALKTRTLEHPRAVGRRPDLHPDLGWLPVPAVVLDAFSRKVVGWDMGGDDDLTGAGSTEHGAATQRNPESVIHPRTISTRAWRSANGVARWACGLHGEPATPTTTRWPRAGPPRWSASYRSAQLEDQSRGRERRCSRGSKVVQPAAAPLLAGVLLTTKYEEKLRREQRSRHRNRVTHHAAWSVSPSADRRRG